MNRLTGWEGSFPVFAREVKGAHVTDADDRTWLDLSEADADRHTRAIRESAEALMRG